ncbi:MAG: phosphoribosylaminoimidazolecarboxamide formyltransferase / cyclohydrolase [Kribbellaceae bacterium]|jgi:phosphoribosylaminoimidazolecarboxamide formyltransferase/IMP cyclohydrolase|nr:phosphoribosylaminoimidazolecarboxamide formyltransferase / cyclohydrolase [Kribbellaceae bacterium]
MRLRYGTNPHQPSTISPVHPDHSPIRLISGEPSYINILDAVGAWQLVQEASTAFDRPAAASFKHVSPAGAALAGSVDAAISTTYGIEPAGGSVTSAYVRARDADPKSSYGDFVAVSHPVDAELGGFLQRLACDGIIAPGYDPDVVGKLSAKKHGTFLVLEADNDFRPPTEEIREIYGLRLTQRRDDLPLTRASLGEPVVGTLTAAAIDDLLLGMIVMRYTQSNSVGYVRDGMAIGIGAGQQSRIDCTSLAGAKADTWWLRRHPDVLADSDRAELKLQERIARQLRHLADSLTPTERQAWLSRLTDVALVSDGAIPFRDNIDEAHRHGVRYIAEPGGSLRSHEVAAACREFGIALTQTGIRLFRH